MVNGNRITYKFGATEAYTLEFSEIIRFQFGLDYHLLEERQQVIIQLICHAMDTFDCFTKRGYIEACKRSDTPQKTIKAI